MLLSLNSIGQRLANVSCKGSDGKYLRLSSHGLSHLLNSAGCSMKAAIEDM